MSTTMSVKGRYYFLIGLFLVCMSGLILQIIDTRMLSVISYYYLAFFAISMAMFGMTAGSLFVFFRQSWFPQERLLENMVWISAAFGLATKDFLEGQNLSEKPKLSIQVAHRKPNGLDFVDGGACLENCTKQDKDRSARSREAPGER